MLNLGVGEILTYDQMTTSLGRDVRANCSGNIQSAKRIVAAEGVILGAVKNVGYKRLDDAGIISKAAGTTKSITRAAKRGLNGLSHVNYSDLDDEKKREHTATAAQLGAVKLFSGAKSHEKIAAVVKSESLAIGETLSVFMK
jgi:hypothetical protein